MKTGPHFSAVAAGTAKNVARTISTIRNSPAPRSVLLGFTGNSCPRVPPGTVSTGHFNSAAVSLYCCHMSNRTSVLSLCALLACPVLLAAAGPAIRLNAPVAHTTDAVFVAISGVAASASPLENIYWLDHLGATGPVQWTASGAWTAQIPLRPGPNRISIVAVDRDNNAVTLPLAIQRNAAAGSQPSEIRTGFLRGLPVTFAVLNGRAIVEGDIDIGPAEHMNENGARGFGLTDGYVNLIWPLVGSVHQIPYTIETGATNLNAALAYVNGVLAGLVQFVPRTAEANYVTFNFDSTNHSGSCESAVGMQTGQQFVAGSVDCATATLVHEMGHTIGLLHEHQRPDRNTFVTFTPANTDKPLIAGNLDLFTTNFQAVGLYDYSSVMHYPPFAFSKNNLPVLESIPPGIPLSNSIGYSVGDLDQINRLYQNAPSSVTVTTNPAGLTIIVDGKTSTAPQTFAWALNSTHTLKLPADPQFTNPKDGSTYEFGNWNDRGKSTHTVTVIGGSGALTSPANKPAVTVYEASYIRLQPFASSVTPPGTGTLAVSPAPQSKFSGAFFVDRQQIKLTATPNGGENFYGWFGPPFPQGGNPYSFLIQAPMSNTQAGFTSMPVTTIGESITGPNTWDPPLYAFIDGNFTFLPQGYSQDYTGSAWAPGTTHSVSAAAPTVPITTNVSYNWNNWSDSGAQTHNITASSSGVETIVGSYTPVYRSYTFAFNNCGTVSYSQTCANNDCSFPDGTVVTMTATPNSGNGMVFSGWTGDLTGLTNPDTVTIHDEFLPVANFNIVPTIITIGAITPSQPAATSSAMDLTITGTGFVNGSFFNYWNNNFRASTVVSSTQATMHLNAGDLSAAGSQLVQASNFTSSCGAFALGQVLVKATQGTPVLQITKKHTGTFTKGELGATYTVTVTNTAIATGPTTGTVTVTDTIPSGLTLVSLSGTGWSCAGATCNRSDALNPGTSYPAITVTVNVSATAPPSVTNKVATAGGGSGAATATDRTIIH